MAGFRFRGTLEGNQTPVLKKWIIEDDSTITVGEAVKLNAGFIVTAGAGGAFLGIVHAIVKMDGIQAPSSDGAGGAFTDTYAAAADNETGDQISVLVDVNRASIYSGLASATLGSTTSPQSSALAGGYFDMEAASLTLDETSVLTTSSQWFSLGPDPDAPTTRLLVVISESALDIH